MIFRSFLSQNVRKKTEAKNTVNKKKNRGHGSPRKNIVVTTPSTFIIIQTGKNWMRKLKTPSKLVKFAKPKLIQNTPFASQTSERK